VNVNKRKETEQNKEKDWYDDADDADKIVDA